MDNDDLNKIFTYQKPSEEMQVKYTTISTLLKELAFTINELCPESREKSLAITSLQLTRMWANAAIAIHDS